MHATNFALILSIALCVVWALPPKLAKNFAWADGHLAFYSTYQANICVGLLNLLLHMCFHESKW